MVFSLDHEQGLGEDVMDLLVVLHLQPDDVGGRRGGPSSGGRGCRPERRWLAGPHNWSAVCLWRGWELHGVAATAMQIYISDSVEQQSCCNQQRTQVSGLSPTVEGH